MTSECIEFTCCMMWGFCICSCIINDWNELFCEVFCGGIVGTGGTDGKMPTGGEICWWFRELSIWCIGSTWSGALKSFLCWLRRCCNDWVWCWFFRWVCLVNGFCNGFCIGLMAGFWCLGSELDKTDGKVQKYFKNQLKSIKCILKSLNHQIKVQTNTYGNHLMVDS